MRGHLRQYKSLGSLRPLLYQPIINGVGRSHDIGRGDCFTTMGRTKLASLILKEKGVAVFVPCWDICYLARFITYTPPAWTVKPLLH